MILLGHGADSTDMQLCRSFGEVRYLSRFRALLPAVCNWSAALSRWLSLIALPEPSDHFDVLQNPVPWVREVAFEVRLRSR